MQVALLTQGAAHRGLRLLRETDLTIAGIAARTGIPPSTTRPGTPGGEGTGAAVAAMALRPRAMVRAAAPSVSGS